MAPPQSQHSSEEHSTGTLRFTILFASNLGKPMPMANLLSTYATITLGQRPDAERTSTVRQGGNAPVFDQTFEFADVQPDETMVHVRLMDKRRFGEDVELGAADIPLAVVRARRREQLSVPLFNTAGAKGRPLFRNKQLQPTGFLHILMSFHCGSMVHGSWVQSVSSDSLGALSEGAALGAASGVSGPVSRVSGAGAAKEDSGPTFEYIYNPWSSRHASSVSKLRA